MEVKIKNRGGLRVSNALMWLLTVLSGTLLGIIGSFAVAVSAMRDYQQMYKMEIGTDTEIISKEMQENLAWIENSPWVVNFADENAQSELLSWLLLAAVALVIVFCAALIILCVQTGRLGRAADGSIQLNRFDRVWSEVLLILGCGAAGGAVALAVPLYEIWFYVSIKGIYTPTHPSDYVFGPSNTAVWILCISGLAVCILLALLCFVSLVKKLKARMFWEKSFFGGIALSIYRGIASSDKTMVKVMALLIGGMLLSMTWFGAVLVLAAIMLCVPRLVRQYLAIRSGVSEVKSGNLAHRIPVETDRRGNVGELGRLAADINEISQASNLAVQNELKNQRMKTELISNVSHDLKTPLTSMVSYIDLMKQEGLDSPHAPEYLEILDEKTQRLKVLTENLFEAAKASSGAIPVHMETIDLGSLVSQSLGEMSARLTAQELDIIVENHCAQGPDAAGMQDAEGGVLSAGPRVMADGQLLWRVIENLLSNVSKYALPGSRVYLDISSVNRKAGSPAGTTASAGIPGMSQNAAAGRAGMAASAGCSTSAGTASAGAAANGFVLLEVKNISRDRLNISADELMERFKRGDESRNTEGSGLGLAIARDLTKLMDGVFEITVDGDLFKASVLLKQA